MASVEETREAFRQAVAACQSVAHELTAPADRVADASVQIARVTEGTTSEEAIAAMTELAEASVEIIDARGRIMRAEEHLAAYAARQLR